ncbi:hypothetical protein [Paenirhodobacter populi]|uniref:Uncharacterized protein n=1 Tax=Paenirhodobacter populi TaxID=2306993 RepID=A0A443IZP4_9RHOB|nr:hypothetical protein [Sinirhodobacter populi]RWR13808.1 hypothetical protein D2T33_05265 [Sinirhodobacter populi]
MSNVQYISRHAQSAVDITRQLMSQGDLMREHTPENTVRFRFSLERVITLTGGKVTRANMSRHGFEPVPGSVNDVRMKCDEGAAAAVSRLMAIAG